MADDSLEEARATARLAEFLRIRDWQPDSHEIIHVTGVSVERGAYSVGVSLGDLRELQAACDEVDALREAVKSLVVAAGRMRDGWAEGDDAYRSQLWQALHTAADDADDRHGVYPL